MASIQKAARPAPDTSGIAKILAEPDWSDVVATDHRKFWLVAGTFNGNRFSQTGKDPLAIAAAIKETALATVLPPRKPAPESEPKPVAPLGYEDERPEEGEPLPDNVARLVPVTVEQQQRKEWLRARWQELTHRLVDNGKALMPLSPAELIEQQELERYRGLFA